VLTLTVVFVTCTHGQPHAPNEEYCMGFAVDCGGHGMLSAGLLPGLGGERIFGRSCLCEFSCGAVRRSVADVVVAIILENSLS
jgi:hypothetical protein